MGNIRKIVRTTQNKLAEIAKKDYSIRVGSTTNPKNRAKQYEREGYSGTIYYAKTSTMKKSENELLKNDPRHNDHKRSNVGENPGYVYVVKGKKYNK